MGESKKTPVYIEALDFSRDSRIRESLLLSIKQECFGSLEDDELDFLNAAGPVDEGAPTERRRRDGAEREADSPFLPTT